MEINYIYNGEVTTVTTETEGYWYTSITLQSWQQYLKKKDMYMKALIKIT